MTTVGSSVETTYYVGDHFEYVSLSASGATVEKTKLTYGGYYSVEREDDGTLLNRLIFVQDRLGSVSTIVDVDQPLGQSGSIVQDRVFDPFGKPDPEPLQVTDQGFTGHRHLSDQQVIHMKGWVYDYHLGRFISPDPIIQDPQNSQSLNAYSYIMNNPLAGTDPTGYAVTPAGEVLDNDGGVRVENYREPRPGSFIKVPKHRVFAPDGNGGWVKIYDGTPVVGNGGGRSSRKNTGISFDLGDVGNNRGNQKDGSNLGNNSIGLDHDAGGAHKGCNGRRCVDRGDGGIPLGDNASYKAAFAPGIGLKFKLLGVEVTILNFNVAEGFEGKFNGTSNPFMEANATLIKLKVGKHSLSLGGKSKAELTGRGDSEFVHDYSWGYSRGNTSTNMSSVGITVTFILKGGLSFDFGPYLSGGGSGTGGRSGRNKE